LPVKVSAADILSQASALERMQPDELVALAIESHSPDVTHCVQWS